jgi:RNA polymerase sigma-54 factor
MNLGFHLSLEQKLKLNITPELKQSIHILQLSGYELFQYLQELAVENPVLEITTQSESFYTSKKTGKPFESVQTDPLWNVKAVEETLEESLLSQLRMLRLSRHVHKAAAFLAGNLNDNGYLSISLLEACASLKMPAETVETALSHVQSLDPPGVCARDLRECLLLQIARDPQTMPAVYEVTSRHLNHLSQGRLDKISSDLGISQEQVINIWKYIRGLNPRPGLAFFKIERNYIIPDAIIQRSPEGFTVTMNQANLPKLALNTEYYRWIKDDSNEEAFFFLKERVRTAKWIMRSVELRRQTLTRVIEAIMEEQIVFLEEGVHGIKPMNLKLISEKIGLHESTVSRAIHNKFVQTPNGVLDLKFFFSTGIQTDDGAFASMKKVKARIKELIAEENKKHPYSDQKIVGSLAMDGIRISRRTVAKYRDQLKILPSSQRKSII